ncbi:tetratricopeptide (TPR) repeat protein [Amycolatopsis bartoniae]|uniref:CHAT domain-containing protein n=1 Tax=Amycolatopsis bartoniae TaxID=941986 RepID=A0A8H9MC20_9PSEU|nr:CHAT domain-containing protein [Amycolatopsis bartoniae]MBB2936820.1 tetratricopeptide (TPR) repeat protein [Amycolatopsis bartoniae]TVT09139.1 CHAT domain-containing protein [Amycolatopsis bartoniae]GHF50372.1 hypothetical protein GCM10017566_24360 [Amycolatopsis bartoniae]
MELGSPQGIRLRFAGGLLASLLLDLHRKPEAALREHLPGAEPLAPSSVPVTRVRQALGAGTRELELTGNGGTVTLRQRFDLRSPLDWRLTVGAPGEATERGVVFALPGQVTVTVESAAPWVADGGEVRVSLPPGASELTVAVASEPVFEVADTVVVCRPDQLREAAVVVSCLPADRFVPVVAVEPPPMAQADYVELYARFKRAQDASLTRIGGAIGMAEALAGDAEVRQRALAEIQEDWRLRKALSPYRSWLKHNELVSDLVSRLGVRRAVFLHDFAPEELLTTDPALMAEADEVWAAAGRDAEDPGERGMFARVPETVRLAADLPELTTAAWRLLRDPGGEPDRVLDVAIDDPGSWVAALFAALHRGAALRPVDHAVSRPDPLSFADDGDEAVLVENTGDAAALLGALYAHHRGARLVVTPPPDLEPVQRAVAAQQERVLAAARASGPEARSGGFAEKLWRRLSTGGRNPYAEIEAAVTAQVPATAVEQVGERRLTAFTSGLPYSFVRTTEADWATKPIGHVAADPALTILNELYSAGIERSPGTFSLVFDPGFFRASETPDVLRSVGTHFTHPVLLSGPDASLRALMDLTKDLPVELVFFNTHGSDEAIVLGDTELSSWLIPQWLSLTHRPIVFNNSCQSWTGVGRQFVRAGARGYLGTLWSIPSRPAADFARVVVDRLTTEERLACEAIVRTGLPSGIERSYLYVGTANGRLDQWRDRKTTAAEAALAESAILAAAARKSASRLLHREITTLRRQADGTPHETTESYVDVLLSELWLCTAHDPPQEEDRATAEQLARRIDATLARLDLPRAELDRRWARRFALTGRLARRWSDWDTALADFRRGVGYGEACADRADLLLSMADLTMRRGDHEEALSLARSAYEAFTEQHDRAGLLGAAGVLGQLSKRLGRLEEAMRYAEEGYETAVALRETGRQGAFKLDQAVLHQLAGNFDAAVAAATRALELSRVTQDSEAELAAIGRLALCHLDRGDLDTAHRHATAGLAQAVELGVGRETAAFHHDLAQIATRLGRFEEAVAHYRQGVAVAFDTGHRELAVALVANLAEAASRVADVDALWSAAVWGTTLCRLVPERWWPDLLSVVIGAVKQVVGIGPVATTRRGLVEIEEAAARGVREHSVPATFVYLLALALTRWVAGEDPGEAAALAQELDSRTGGAFDLRTFVATPYAPPATGGRRWRRN